MMNEKAEQSIITMIIIMKDSVFEKYFDPLFHKYEENRIIVEHLIKKCNKIHQRRLKRNKGKGLI